MIHERYKPIFHAASAADAAGAGAAASGAVVAASATSVGVAWPLTDPLNPPPTVGGVPINLTTLWAWDNPQSKWYFYSPSLDGKGGTALLDYTTGKGYLDFAATDVAHCFGSSLPGLQIYRPHLRYHLVDEARLKLHPLAQVRNLAEALFRLERRRTPSDIFDIIKALNALLQDAQMKPLRRTLSIWLKIFLRRKVPNANMTELDAINDLLEADTMLEQTIERWFDEATDKGLQKGMQQGMQQGL